MKIIIDTDKRNLALGNEKVINLYSKEAFELISDLWLKTSWNQKYSYTFTWMGRPIIQHPEDTIRLQEVIYFLKPDIIIETGVAHGGSLIFYASLFRAMGHVGRVVGVDIEIRPHNRTEIEKHELSPYITLIEGNSVAPEIVAQATKGIKETDVVMILLDSNHSYDHVMRELEIYSPYVSKDSYIVVTDGIMEYVYDTPRGQLSWLKDNPKQAAIDFVANCNSFTIADPIWRFNESELETPITGWPSAWLKKVL